MVTVFFNAKKMSTDRQVDLNNKVSKEFVAVYFLDGTTSTVPRKLVDGDIDIDSKVTIKWNIGRGRSENYPASIIGYGGIYIICVLLFS